MAERRGHPVRLEPLSRPGQGEGASLRGGPPPNFGNNMMSTTGGAPVRATNETVISVPEGGGSHAAHGGDHVVSVPGSKSRSAVAPMKQKPRNLSSVGEGRQMESVEIVVYFQDKSGLHLSVADGQRCEAGELFEMVMDEMKFPAEAREVFSLWLVSDLLELQLKPTHIPFKLVCYWEELLEKYTSVDEDDRERDEPVIVFQRNVFYPRSKEKQLTDPEILRLLYQEAKEMVIDGRYPLKQDDYDFLAGMQALIQYKHFDSYTHTPDFYRSKLAEYYPDLFAKLKWKFPGIKRADDSPEYKLSRFHRHAFENFGALESDEVALRVHMAYLQFCWKLPFYGCAFFRGQIEHPSGKWRLRSVQDDPVYIAINTDGVFILDMDDVEFLMGLTYKQLSWEYAEPRDKENPDCMPCLFLQFAAVENNEKVSKLLQIFTKEAQLVDALIEACIKLKETEKSQGASSSEDEAAIMKASGETWSKFNRLCLATFSRGGQLKHNPARVPKPN